MLPNSLSLFPLHRGLSAGIYTTSGPEACAYVASDCKANIIVVENQKQLDKILQVPLELVRLTIVALPTLC